ncbi:hypothetical protein Tco_1176484 [Tanacetum coccineum]
MGHFARECRAPRSKDNRNWNQGSSSKAVKIEDASEKAMMWAIYCAGFDWSDMVEEEIQANMALMAFSDSEVEKKTVIPTATKKEFVKPEKPVRRSVRHVLSVEVLITFNTAVPKTSSSSHTNIMAPKAVSNEDCLKSVNTFKPVNCKAVKHVRSVNTGRPFSTARFAEATTDDNGEVQITATINGHSMSITEASLRRHLKLDDHDGISSIPNSKIFEQLALIGYHIDSDKLTFQKGAFSPQWRFLIRNILHCLSLKKTA